MALLERLKDIVGSDQRVYDYECVNCGAVFQSPHADLSKVTCPECRGTDVTSYAP
ncbi:FmdB family zinc ribbon protein [Halorarius halobius]|uniref:FmdB family zinc ribbon protein n=1 Tax=Halorarius halobius TaxID=2962671 RepID=UPI0020CC1DAF|nr:zinc ribbon domain-containing protein [Halorarius halobius]